MTIVDWDRVSDRLRNRQDWQSHQGGSMDPQEQQHELRQGKLSYQLSRVYE